MEQFQDLNTMDDIAFAKFSERINKQFEKIVVENVRRRMGGNKAIHNLSDKRNYLFRKFK